MPSVASTHTPPSPEPADSDIVNISPPLSTIATMNEKEIKDEYIENSSQEKVAEVKKEEGDAEGMVDETVRRVREQSDRIQAAALPYANKTRTFAENRPVLFTFLAIFGVLSIIPISCFVGFVLSSILFIVGVAAVCICASVVAVILLGSAFLLPTLFITSLISLTTLAFLLTLFLVHRLYLHIASSTTKADGTTSADYAHISQGVRAWVDETVSRIPEIPIPGTGRVAEISPQQPVESNGYTSRGVETDVTLRPQAVYTIIEKL